MPLATTLPIFLGGVVRGLADWTKGKPKGAAHSEEDELGKGSLFATGLVAGGALAGVVVALLSVDESVSEMLKTVNAERYSAKASAKPAISCSVWDALPLWR